MSDKSKSPWLCEPNLAPREIEQYFDCEPPDSHAATNLGTSKVTGDIKPLTLVSAERPEIKSIDGMPVAIGAAGQLYVPSNRHGMEGGEVLNVKVQSIHEWPDCCDILLDPVDLPGTPECIKLRIMKPAVSEVLDEHGS